MIMEIEQWSRFVKGFHVVSGAMGFDNTRYCFVLEEDGENHHRDPPPTLRLLFARMERPLETRFYRVDFEAFSYTTAACGSGGHEDEFVAVDLWGNVIAYNQDEGRQSAHVEQGGIDTQWLGGERRAAINRIKRVNGRLYAVAQDRMLLERRGSGHWLEFPGLERPRERLDEKTMPLDFGFQDMDAFGPNDVYAVGGKGEVWRYDGRQWRRCSFPAKEWLFTVCCGGDGRVYITGKRGAIWRGGGDTWEKIGDAAFSGPFNDVVWFAGKLWCSNDHDLYTLHANGLARADTPSDARLTARRLSVSPDGKHLLSAGNHGASVFDGKEWQLLFSDLELDS